MSSCERRLDRLGEQADTLIEGVEGYRGSSAKRPGPPYSVQAMPVPPMQPLGEWGAFQNLAGEKKANLSQLQLLMEQISACEDSIEEMEDKRYYLLLAAHRASMEDSQELSEELGPEVAECLLGFTVDDPYEICFGYLCLIESGSDLPWLYNAALAVLLAAARKLPWNAFPAGLPDPDDLDEPEDGEDLPDDAEADESAEQPALDIPIPGAPLDWSQEKKRLYELNYSDIPLYAPLESPMEGWKINMAQLVFGLTGGTVMPRQLDYAGLTEEFIAAGMSPDGARMMEMYLQLAADAQTSGSGHSRALHSDLLRHTDELCEMAGDIADPSPEADAEELRKQLVALKRQNDELKQALYAASKEAEKNKLEADCILNEAADERQELLDLRELVFNRENEADGTETEDGADSDIPFPYTNEGRVIVFGGHDTWLKAIKPLLPNVVFIPRGQNPNVDMIRLADVVWIQTNSLSHKVYDKIINVARTRRIPVRYFGYASAKKCAIQLAQEDMKRNAAAT